MDTITVIDKQKVAVTVLYFNCVECGHPLGGLQSSGKCAWCEEADAELRDWQDWTREAARPQ